MTSAYIAILGLRPILTNISTQDINSLVLGTHGMTTTSFSLQDS